MSCAIIFPSFRLLRVATAACHSLVYQVRVYTYMGTARGAPRRATRERMRLLVVVCAAYCSQASEGRAGWAATVDRRTPTLNRRLVRVRGGSGDGSGSGFCGANGVGGGSSGTSFCGGGGSSGGGGGVSGGGDGSSIGGSNGRGTPGGFIGGAVGGPPLTGNGPSGDRPSGNRPSGDRPPGGASADHGGILHQQEQQQQQQQPMAAGSAPFLPEALPAGPVNPFSRSVPVLRLSSEGTAVETTLSRQQLAAELNCPLRDLRVADPTFPGQFPSVLARCGSIIFSVAEVKAVIRSRELLLFPSNPDVLSIVSSVQEKIPGGIAWAGMGGSVPFEQTAMECCLKYVCHELHESVHNVEPRLRTVLDSFETSKNSLINSLHRLLPLKNELDELQETLVSVCKCMNEVLMSDEDMALMYLTAGEQSGGAARDPRQHQEVEMLFENYLFQVELLASDVREFQNEVRNTEEIVEIELDVLRNNILRFELLLSISAFTVTLGALVTGVFGMNLLSGWEEQPSAFWRVTGGIYVCIVLSIAGTVAWCRRLSLL